MSQVPDWQVLKRNEVAKIRNGQESDYLLLGVIPPYTDSKNTSIILCVSKDNTIDEFLRLLLIQMKKRIGRAYKDLQDVFVTLDQEGKVSLGKRTTKLSDSQLNDGQILYLTYIFTKFKHGGRWKPAMMTDAVDTDKVCSQCGQTEEDFNDTTKQFSAFPVHFINAYIGFKAQKICIDCLAVSLKLDGDEPVQEQLARNPKTYICTHCGNRGAGLYGDDNLLALMSRCVDKCAETPISRICAVCDIPVEQRLKCGKCRKICYCSKECQSKDWPEHKQVCQ